MASVTSSPSEPRFEGISEVGPHGSITVRLPFAPHDVWGVKPKHHVNGTLNGMKILKWVGGQKSRP